MVKNITEGVYDDFFRIKKASILKLKVEDSRHNHACKNVSVLNESVTDTLLNIDDACALVFGSAKNPGGGVLNGAVAQEEELAMKTTWYFHVKNLNDFYDKKQTALNSDDILFIDEAYLLYDEFYNELEEPKKIKLIGAAAPNLKGLKEQEGQVDEIKVYGALKKRIILLIQWAEKQKIQNLILGAWGCGVFGLEPRKVANIFREVIENNSFSGKILFSIADKEMCEIFNQELNQKITKTNKISSK